GASVGGETSERLGERLGHRAGEAHAVAAEAGGERPAGRLGLARGGAGVLLALLGPRRLLSEGERDAARLPTQRALAQEIGPIDDVSGEERLDIVPAGGGERLRVAHAAGQGEPRRERDRGAKGRDRDLGERL